MNNYIFNPFKFTSYLNKQSLAVGVCVKSTKDCIIGMSDFSILSKRRLEQKFLELFLLPLDTSSCVSKDIITKLIKR